MFEVETQTTAPSATTNLSITGQPLQVPFLEALRKEEVPVSVYLVNGIKLQGQIEAYDESVVLLKNNLSQIIYKHAISTIVPMRRIVLKGFSDDEAMPTED